MNSVNSVRKFNDFFDCNEELTFWKSRCTLET